MIDPHDIPDRPPGDDYRIDRLFRSGRYVVLSPSGEHVERSFARKQAAVDKVVLLLRARRAA